MGLTFLLQQRSQHPLKGRTYQENPTRVFQGDVVSPYLFILAVEVLLIKTNNTKLIKGITYAQNESRSKTIGGKSGATQLQRSQKSFED